ncbi:MAG: EAL domain-containing protein [Clostridiales bacterium]|nr:EAL domain-containing protein [Clostridiales bacterium]
MKKDKTSFIDRYLKKKINSPQNNLWANIKYIGLIILYLIIQITAINLSNNRDIITYTVFDISISRSGITGVIVQLLTIVSIKLVLDFTKKGYIAALLLNIYSSFISAVGFFIYRNVDSAPGIVIPLICCFIISIIYHYYQQAYNMYEEEAREKQELTRLYKDVELAKEELTKKNKTLMEYNNLMMENEKKLNHLAFFDMLTDLPNRKMIISRLNYLIDRANDNPTDLAVVFIDLDNFKRVNDTMGHHSGDLLLQSATSRMKTLIKPNDMLGRLGGDEFALIIQQPLSDEEIFEYLTLLKNVIEQPFTIEKNEFTITASFGFAVFPEDGKNSIDLLKCADTAMYKAKEQGKNNIVRFSKEMNEEITRRMEFENKMMSAIQKDEMYLVFQPQYSTDKELRGFEALVRWKSAELGVVNPLDFIPIAEETKYIIPLGEWILKTACNIFMKLRNELECEMMLSINISSVQIMDPSFLDMVKKILEQTNFPPNLLEFEITESVFISSMDYVIDILNKLKKIGVKIALDDFGTGYSSLNYLQMLPIDTLKIDKSFVDNINSENARKQIVGPIISLVHQMNISVIAEGVETEEQLKYLRNHKCDFIQGYLFGKPLTNEDLYNICNVKKDT